MQKAVLRQIHQLAQKTGDPIFVILDDTLCEKTRPSLQAASPIQGASFHFSHVERKKVWGHQLVFMLLQCGNLCLPYGFRRYDKTEKNKIELACDLLRTLPVLKHPAYLLVDSWYTSEKIANLGVQQGVYLLGGLKTNRILYPLGIRTAAKDLAVHITEADTRLVTVGEASYHVYRYEESLNGLENGVVLFCWPRGQLGKNQSMRCFLSLDVSLKDETLLAYYRHRWSIEVLFQRMKGAFSMDGYRVRSIQAIERFWSLLFWTVLYVSQTDETGSFGDLHCICKKRSQGLVDWVYSMSRQGVSLHQVREWLNIA